MPPEEPSASTRTLGSVRLPPACQRVARRPIAADVQSSAEAWLSARTNRSPDNA